MNFFNINIIANFLCLFEISYVIKGIVQHRIFYLVPVQFICKNVVPVNIDL